MQSRLFIVLCCIWMLILPTSAQNPDINNVTPSTIAGQICGTRCIGDTVSVVVPPLPEGLFDKLDIVFALDVTTSMSSVLAQAKASSITIGQAVQANIADTRFAVINFTDYDFNPPFPWNLAQDFNTNVQTLQTTINSLQIIAGGQTFPESSGRALWEAGQLAWRDDALKLIVLFTDNAPLDPDYGVDGRRNTGDDLNFSEILDSLALRDIRVIAVNSGRGSIQQLELAASVTDGQTFRLEDANNLASRVIETVTTEIEEQRDRFQVRLAPDVAPSTWVTVSPASYPYPSGGGTLEFTTNFCPETSQLSTDVYQFDLVASNDFTRFGQTTFNVDYSEICADIIIADHASDDGRSCSDVNETVFWESPNIIVRRFDDAGDIFEYPIMGQENYIYVRVKNIGIEVIDSATLTVYQSPDMIAPDFPGSWQPIGTIDFSIGVDEELKLGPLPWTPSTEFVSLRSHVDSEVDPIELINDVACENSIAQMNQMTVKLDDYSSEPGKISETISMVLTNPPTMGHDNLDFSLFTNDTSSRGYVRFLIEPTYLERWRSNSSVIGGNEDAYGVVSDSGTNTMTLPDFIPQFDERITGQLTIASADTVAFNKVEARLIARDRIIAGTSIYLYADHPVVVSDTPVDSENNSWQIVLMGFGIVMALTFVLFVNRP